MSSLQAGKLWLIDLTGLAKDALHIYVGLLVFLLAAVVFRWPLGTWRPWLAVLAVTIAGEIWDIADRARLALDQNAMGNWKDVWNTLFWPTVLTLLARYSRVLRRRR